MRTVGLNELASLPAGTVYSAYDPSIIRGLFVKGETIQHDKAWVADFFETYVIPPHFSPGNEDIGDRCRWGEMDPDAQFVVYDDNDVRKMIALLGGTLCSGGAVRPEWSLDPVGTDDLTDGTTRVSTGTYEQTDEIGVCRTAVYGTISKRPAVVGTAVVQVYLNMSEAPMLQLTFDQTGTMDRGMIRSDLLEGVVDDEKSRLDHKTGMLVVVLSSGEFHPTARAFVKYEHPRE